MRTDDLDRYLVRRTGAGEDRRRDAHACWALACWAWPVSGAGDAADAGACATTWPRHCSSFGLWLKLAYTFAIAAFGFWLVERERGRPGAPFTLGLRSVGAAGAGDRGWWRRRSLWRPAPIYARSGHGPYLARVCPFLVVMVSLPMLIASFWALRRLAPTRLTLAGALAGLFAGGAGALVYSLHCPETRRALCRPLVQHRHPAHRRYRRGSGPPPAALVKHSSRFRAVTSSSDRSGSCANSFLPPRLLLLAVRRLSPSDPLMDGGSAYERGDYPRALAAWQPLAASGNAEAQNNLALLYLDGKGMPRNLPEAVRYFQLSAAAGSALGQNNLGGLYRDGNGLPRDFGKAARWFGASASQGNSAGMYNLGLMYELGQGV